MAAAEQAMEVVENVEVDVVEDDGLSLPDALTLLSLPDALTQQMLVSIGSLQALGRCASACSRLRDLVADDAVWQPFSHGHYGLEGSARGPRGEAVASFMRAALLWEALAVELGLEGAEPALVASWESGRASWGVLAGWADPARLVGGLRLNGPAGDGEWTELLGTLGLPFSRALLGLRVSAAVANGQAIYLDYKTAHDTSVLPPPPGGLPPPESRDSTLQERPRMYSAADRPLPAHVYVYVCTCARYTCARVRVRVRVRVRACMHSRQAATRTCRTDSAAPSAATPPTTSPPPRESSRST